MDIKNFAWAFNKVIRDWFNRSSLQSRKSLPTSFTSSILRRVRANACRKESSGRIECAKWTQKYPISSELDLPSTSRTNEKLNGAFLVTSKYVCNQCKHPRVTNEILIEKLGLYKDNNDFSVRSWRRYSNGTSQMTTKIFLRAVAFGYIEGWLDKWQFITITNQILDLDAARDSLNNVYQRATERKDFLQNKEINISEAEIGEEIEKQFWIKDSENNRRLALLLESKDLPSDIEQFIKTTLLAKKTF